jgi:glutathione synthase/RimK-type ligase-like ATP-grasp enzyme
VILAITHAGDEHAPPLLDALARLGAEAVVLDLADLPVRGGMVLGYGPGAAPRELRVEGRPPIRARDVTGVWWRRPRPFAADPALAPAHQSFATRQAGDAVMGFLSSLQARFVNDPWAAHRAEHKTGQLVAAERVGLAVPRTCVTTDPSVARAFVEACGPVGAVHKQLHRLPGDSRPTRRVEHADLAKLPAIRQAPPIFQEYVAGVDVRATVVGDEVFAAEIDARATATPEDFRESFDACPMTACELPAEVAGRLRGLCRSLGLLYAAIDLRRREDGALLFLEANPAGQYQFVEERTGQPITAALAALLAGAR